MRIGWRGLRNERAGQKQVARGRNVIARLVPEIRKAQKRRMEKHQSRKEQREQKKLLRPGGGSRLGFSFQIGVRRWPHRHQWTGPPGARGSSLISPNADS